MNDTVSVRYMVSDVAKALAFYAGHLSFTVESDFAPAFGSVQRGTCACSSPALRARPAGPCLMALSPAPAAGTGFI
jgi:catechol 2,3-dioxygenase-like lactoylglutathione lyase family enzyme